MWGENTLILRKLKKPNNIFFSKALTNKGHKNSICKKGLQFKPLEILILQDIRHLTQEPV